MENRVKNSLFPFLLVAAISPSAVGQDKELKPLEVVPTVDLVRYAGTWYEIARLPNTFQKQCISDVTATYTLLENQDIEVVNRCRKEDGTYGEAEGRAKRADEDGPPAKLKVRFAPAYLSFLWFVWGNYWIIDLAPDYTYAVIGEPDRKYLWILCRTPQMEETIYQGILRRIGDQGYDASRLIRTQHTVRGQ